LSTPGPQAALPAESWAAYSGAIDQTCVQRFVVGFTAASVQKVKKIHLYFHSSGGNVGDGIALYELFRAIPIDLTLYNPGVVASIATIAYLGANHRKTSAHAVFGLHRTRYTAGQPATAGTLKSLAEAATIDDARTEAIVRANTTLPAEKWAYMDQYDLTLTAEDAVAYGFADEIVAFQPPPGAAVYGI